MFHELAHGFVAWQLGDNTAKQAGRLTFNPIAHLDIMGVLCMVIAGVGWAKPVPVNPSNFRMKNRKVGMAITAFAGPLANILLSFLLLFIAVGLLNFAPQTAIISALSTFMIITARLSVGLGVFNLIPIPPLDGSKILQIIVPNRYVYKMYQYEPYFQAGLLILIFLGALDGVLLSAQSVVMNGILSVIQSIYGLWIG